MTFAPVTRLHVYYHRSPEERLLVGGLVYDKRRALFEYDADFRATGLHLSPFKLPPDAGLLEAPFDRFGGLHGLFDDSLPDGWGRLLLDRYVRGMGVNPASLTPLDRLAWVGLRAIGALSYEPQHEIDSDHEIADLHKLGKEAQLVVDDKTTEALETLLHVGGSPQGARPKALVLLAVDGSTVTTGMKHKDGFEPYLVKFNAKGDPAKTMGAIEYAYSMMAREAGVDMPETRLIAPEGDHLGYFGIKRFDRRGAQRVHTHTVSGLIDAEPGVTLIDYETVLQVTQVLTRNAQEVKQVFRRATFNVFAHNRDDHTRNIAFLMEPDGAWHLTPAYDITFSPGPGGEHTLTIGGEGRNPGTDHLHQLAANAGIRTRHAIEIINEVRETCLRWPNFAKDAGVPRSQWKPISDELHKKK